MPNESGTRPDREAIKVLALAVGVREAARRMGLSEDRVRNWSSREAWFQNGKIKPAMDNRVKPVDTKVTPAAAYASVMQDKHKNVRHNLAKYCENASVVARKHRAPLAIAPLVDKAASVMAKVWPEQQNQAGLASPLSLNVLCGQAAIQVNPTTTDT